MSEYKVGDRIVCIENSRGFVGMSYFKGKIYTISEKSANFNQYYTEEFRIVSIQPHKFRLATKLDEVLA